MQQHVFQPCPLSVFEVDPFTKISKDWMTITAGTKEKANTMTASWGGFGTIWDKSVAFVFVRESRYTKEFLDSSDGFSLNFFEESERRTLKYLGTVSGRNEDKFSNARLNLLYYKKRIPYINEAHFALICNKLAAVPMGEESVCLPNLQAKFYPKGDYHTMYIGEIIDVLAR